jgi:hypothetical protein
MFRTSRSLKQLDEYTELRRLELRPSFGALCWLDHSQIDEVVCLTGLTELKWVDPGYGAPGSFERGILPRLHNFTNLQVLCGVLIWSEDQFTGLASLSSLTHLEFAIRGDLPAACLTCLTMLKVLGVEYNTRIRDTLADRAQFMEAIAGLTQLEDLRLAQYHDLGKLGSSLSKLTALSFSCQEVPGDYLPLLATYNLGNLVSLSLSLIQGRSNTYAPPVSWSILCVASKLEHLVLDVRDNRYRADMLKAVVQLTTLTYLEMTKQVYLSKEDAVSVNMLTRLTRLASLRLTISPA